jgi:hypothetical protein
MKPRSLNGSLDVVSERASSIATVVERKVYRKIYAEG